MKIFRNAFSTSLTKRLVISLLTVGMAFHLSGCAMGGSSDEGAAATGEETFAEESSGDFAEGEESAEGAEAPAEGEAVAEGEEEAPAEGEVGAEDGTEEVAEAGEEKAAPAEDDLALEGEELGGDVAANDGEDELSLDDEEGLPSDIASNAAPAEPAPIIDEPAPPTDAPVFAEPPSESTADTDTNVATAPSEPAAWVPLKKMKTEAFTMGSTNLNRVYVARPGDTKQGIAEKIYGDKTRAKDLSKWNGFLSRGVKTGDKIYYSSPTNPTDTRMLTYFEDVGVPAQNYVSRDGDNIRAVSKTLLGDKDSWKEVWSTNPDIESKGDIAAGLNIRYWPDGSAPPAPMAPIAQNPAETGAAPQDPMAPPVADPLVDPLAQQQVPGTTTSDPLAPPPHDPLAANNGLAPNDPVAAQGNPTAPADPLAVPPPTGTPASEAPPVVGTTEPPPPPPAPPAEPQHPTTTADEKTHQADAAGASTEEADNMMMMGLGGIVLLAAGAVFFLMRRSRSRKIDLTQTTQVG